MPKSRASPSESAPTPYWRRNLRLIALLLVVWAALTFVPAFFARSLTFNFIGWPFAFWMAAYGAPLAYLIIIAIFARTMNRADERAVAGAEAGADPGFDTRRDEQRPDNGGGR